MSSSTLTNAPDLRTGFPRSPNESLGFYVILPRIIDKCRATVAGTHGDYNFNCPLDRLFFDFAEVDSDRFKEQVAAGKSDEELLQWIQGNGKAHDEDDAIKAWSYKVRWRRPEPAHAGFFETLRLAAAPQNYQIETWFQLLDVEEGRL